LSDVAVKAGVSVTTASYILNGRSVEMRISKDATKRVQTAAAELQYRPTATPVACAPPPRPPSA
jgi:LacI family transcriptional regulator